MCGEKQKYLKVKGVIAFITMMNMFVPLSIDLYLPAIPVMGTYFSASTAMINLTLVAFFFFFAVGILVFGPLSDKYGRRPILLSGIVLYIVASGLCAISATVEQLIVFRIFQALGAGCMIAISMAMVKDCFSGTLMNKILSVTQAFAVIAPMAAPIAGAFILQFTSWRGAFWILMLIGVIALALGLLFQESLPDKERYHGNIWATFGRLVVVSRNRGFSGVLIVFAILSAPYMAYIAVSSYIYITYFQLSAQLYSYYFAFNSVIAVFGPVFYLQMIRHVTVKQFSVICFVVSLASGILLLVWGRVSPVLFLIAFLPFTLIDSAIRPFSTSLLLNQQEGDVGSASSLINAAHTIFGSSGMVLGALPWSTLVDGLGTILLIAALLAWVGWILILRRNWRIIGLE